MALETGLEGKPWYFGLILGLIVAALLLGVGYKLQIEDKQARIEAQKGELQALEVKIQQGLAAQRELPQFREAVRELELELDKLLRILPARRNTPELLRRIRALAEQGDFGFRRFTPGAFVDKEFYSEWPISIDLAGDYHNLALLFDRVSRFSRIINVENLTVVATPADGGQTISASFVAKTFIYKEPPPETLTEEPVN
ncbi:MAG: type 4a pilus biogenesis protein PilO [Acidobacteriota bacterium]